MVTTRTLGAWGGSLAKGVATVSPASHELASVPQRPFLACGNGRSYGDTCLPAGDCAILTGSMKSVLSFDKERGILRAESGITLHEIIDIILPHGWFLPVTPGTGYVTLGGALCNDVHGKNHHNAGTFGRFVTCFELLRSDGSRRICSLTENSDLFRATIGGMGLTGLVNWAEISLIPVSSAWIEQSAKRFANIDQFFEIEHNEQSDAFYSVAWLDGLASGNALGRGLVLKGQHAASGDFTRRRPRHLSLPFASPINVVTRRGLRILNAAYYRQSTGARRVSCDKFFYPLDTISNWNGLYGPKGFHQFQCAVPTRTAPALVPQLLETVLRMAGGSGLVVLKRFGDLPSPGLLSFPMPGYTLTLDVAHRGEETLKLLARMDRLVLDAGGRINPYKDSQMSREVFEASFPHWRAILPSLDPLAESAFSRRIGLTHTGRADASMLQPKNAPLIA